MTYFSKQTRPETIIYTVVWIVLFMAPVAELVFNYDPEHSSWFKRGLLDTWSSLLTFFVVFLVHNHVLAPLLVKHKKVVHYIIGCVLVVTLFQTVQCAHKPKEPHHGPAREHAMRMPPPPGARQPIDKHDITMFTIVIMMIGANLGMKAYFQNEEDKKRLARLKEQSLKQELDYLRYQINPHFIMNTLNNIHALVDIDPEQAKDSIIDISRMMRYLLYQSDKQYVMLSDAIIFLKKYLNLMKLRFNDQVTINLDVPSSCAEGGAIVPLVFIPFVENAFKHGVTHGKPSTIDIDIEQMGNRLMFHCHNTKSHAKHEYGGVGLSNVTKRLELIYGTDYSLDISDLENDYDVKLILPVKSPEDFNNNDNHEPDNGHKS